MSVNKILGDMRPSSFDRALNSTQHMLTALRSARLLRPDPENTDLGSKCTVTRLTFE